MKRKRLVYGGCNSPTAENADHGSKAETNRELDPGWKSGRAAERRDFLETTPGQRVEQAIELSSVLSQLAASAQSRRSRELREQ